MTTATKPKPKKTTTGFCTMGHCEGTKPKSYSGKPMKTCPFSSADCGCKCHADLDMMFQMANMERQPQHNPEYSPDPAITKIADCLALIREEAYQRSIKSRVRDVVVVQSKMPDVLPPNVVSEFGPTESGRKARGQLEDEVKRVTDMWVAMAAIGDMQPCTPPWVAERIDPENPPSTGAISAVFERWALYGFCTIEKKPTRFTGYTPDGISKGLHVLKAQAKAAGKRAQDRRNRGER